MVKQPAMEASEFTMSNEDFPALPGVPGPNPGGPAPVGNIAVSASLAPASLEDLGAGGMVVPPQPQQGPIGKNCQFVSISYNFGRFWLIFTGL